MYPRILGYSRRPQIPALDKFDLEPFPRVLLRRLSWVVVSRGLLPPRPVRVAI